MANDKCIKLKDPVPCMDSFTYECAKCGGYLFATDNFCPICGENVSGCLGVVILRDGENNASN